MTSAAFNSGLWTAWRPDGRLQGSPGSGFCSPSQSAQPLITHSSEHNRGTLYLGPPPSSWDTQGRRKENGGLSVTCAVRWPHPKHSSLFSCPRQLGSVRHECLSSSLMPGGGVFCGSKIAIPARPSSQPLFAVNQSRLLMRDGPLSGKHIDKNNESFILLPSVDAWT